MLAPLHRRDVLRVADFFEGRLSAAYAFARSVWLPDAAETLEKISHAILDPRQSEIAFLCDHLREGARSIGAHAYIAIANNIEASCEADRHEDALEEIRDARRRLAEIDAWLERRSQPPNRPSTFWRTIMKRNRLIASYLHVVPAIVAGALFLSGCSGSSNMLPSRMSGAANRPIGMSSPDRMKPSTLTGVYSNVASFNATAIPAGRTIWFSEIIKAQGLGSNTPVTVYTTGGSISFMAGGTRHTVSVPDSAITFAPSAASATLSYTNGAWLETVPATVGNNVMLSAVQLPVKVALSGGIRNVTWTSHFSSTQQRNLKLQWAWSAAAYSGFNADYTQLGVKPVDANNSSQYQNADPAGTPENYKAGVTSGATGAGGTSYTGALSATVMVTPGYAATSPLPTPTPALGPDGTIFIANTESLSGSAGTGVSSIAKFMPGADTSPAAVINPQTSQWNPSQMNFDARGNLWVANQPPHAELLEFSAASGNVTLVRQIVPATTPTSYFAVAVDASGKVYASRTNAIDVYAATAKGISSPIRTIAGSATQLGIARRLVIDANGNLWAGALNGLLEYRAGASGNVAPINGVLDANWANHCNGGQPLTPSRFAFDKQGDLILMTDGQSLMKISAPLGETSCPSQVLRVLNQMYDFSMDDRGYIYDLTMAPASDAVQIYAPNQWAVPVNPEPVAQPYATIPANQGNASVASFFSPSIAVWSSPSFLSGNLRLQGR